jgi:uncharacterized protein (DUF736 family)
MATIGTFKLENGAYVGVVETLTCAPSPARIEPVRAKAAGSSPDYRVYRGASEVGAAWIQQTKDKRRYLVVTLDDPAFARPIECRLVSIDGQHTLIWTRPNA